MNKSMEVKVEFTDRDGHSELMFMHITGGYYSNSKRHVSIVRVDDPVTAERLRSAFKLMEQ